MRPTLATVAVPLLLLAALPAGAAPVETPDGFVHRLYARYRANGPGVSMSRPDGVPFYTAALLDAFAKDQAGAQTKGVTIDWDPICGCTDYNLRLKAVAISKAEAGTLKARVTLVNLGSRQTRVLTLQQTPAGWRVADIGDDDVTSIVALLEDAARHPAPSNDAGATPPTP